MVLTKIICETVNQEIFLVGIILCITIQEIKTGCSETPSIEPSLNQIHGLRLGLQVETFIISVSDFVSKFRLRKI